MYKNKILFFMSQLFVSGGLERTLVDKVNYLSENGFDVMIVTYCNCGRTLYYPIYPNVKLLDLDCRYFDLYKFSFLRKASFVMESKMKFRERFRKVVNGFKPDIIVITTPNTAFFIHDIVKIANGIKIVVESHVSYNKNLSKRPLIENLVYLFNDPLRAIQKASLLVALTKEDSKCWRSHGVKNVRVIPNPVTAYEDVIDDSQREKCRIISVGRLDSQKRYDRLIDAFSQIAEKYPSWHINIFGEGNEKERIQTQIREYGLRERIEIHSPVADIYSEYKKSDFLVLSSDYEGFGLVLVEAMACGIPVVSCDCPFGPSEIIEDGVTGLLSKMDVSDLAEKIEWMISHPVEREEMGRKAHLAAARYRKEVVMKEWERAYLSVLSL